MISFREWDNEAEEDDEDAQMDRARKIGTVRGITPDDLYHQESNSITFIYDPKTDKFDAAPYPQYHGYMILGHNTPDAEKLRNEAIAKGQILGRFGEFEYQKAITYWGTPSTQDLKRCLVAIAKDYPEYATSPQGIMLVGHKQEPVPLSDFFPEISKHAGTQSKAEPPKPKDNEACKEIGITVNGRFLDLGTVISNLHMVKGVNGELMKSTFCADADRLKKQAQTNDCKNAESLIDNILSRIGCKNQTPEQKWQQGKEAGSYALRADYQKTFSNPSSIDTQFRGRQSEIDKAWDFLRGRKVENFSGFKGWLLNEGKHEKVGRRHKHR